MPHVVVAGPIHAAGLAILKAVPDLSVEIADDTYVACLERADALLIRTQPLTGAMVAAAPRLRIVSRHGVGYDAVDSLALQARGIVLTIIGDVNSRAVAEHTLALMISLAKTLTAFDRATRGGEWGLRNGFAATELWHKTLLLVGFGRIGQRVAQLARGFDMRILAFAPRLDHDALRRCGGEAVATLDEGLARADILSLHLPKTGAQPVLGARELALLRPGALLINTARGGLVDEAAVVAALDSGHLGGFGSDVFAFEPPLANDTLLRNPRTILTPHSAAATAEGAIRMAERSAQSIVDFFAGKLDPAFVVTPPSA